MQNLDPNTPRILVLNYPGNPTGMTYTSSELSDIAQAAKEQNILIISDEIYGWLNHNNNHESIATYYPEGTFITSGLSKWCGAGGWRLGTGIFPLNASKEFKITYNGIASETYSTTAAPIQFTATYIYNNLDKFQSFIQSQQQILKTVSQSIVNLLKTSGVNIHQPDGGFYIFPDFSPFQDALLKNGVDTSEKLCVELLNQKGVAMLPASAFGFSEATLYTRLCYVDFDGSAAIQAVSNDISVINNADSFTKQYAPALYNGVSAICDYLKSL